jgi:hypothetical protein
METEPVMLLSTLVIAIVEIIKKTFPEYPVRFIPLSTLVISVVGGYIIGVQPLDSVIVGLTASGIYSQVKTTFGK